MTPSCCRRATRAFSSVSGRRWRDRSRRTPSRRSTKRSTTTVGQETSWPLASAYLARSRARDRRAHRGDLAERDFESGIGVFERLRAGVTSSALRTSYFEQPWDLFSEMVRLHADRRDADAALLFAERARARTLLEAVEDRGDAQPGSPSAIQATLPNGVAVV